MLPRTSVCGSLMETSAHLRLRSHVWLPGLNFRVAPRPVHIRRSPFWDHLKREIQCGTCPCTLSPATT